MVKIKEQNKKVLTKPKAVKSVSGGKAPIFNLQGENVGEIALSPKVFNIKDKDELISQAVRIHQANMRSSHAKAKDRGEVAGTTKKMWAQKGTGRARHSTAKAGIFVGGGSAHGPQGNQNYKLKLNKKVKKLAFNAILSKFAQNKLIIVIDQFKSLVPKTKEACNFIDRLEKNNEVLANSKKIAIITKSPQSQIKRAFGNIPLITPLSLNSLNLYNLSNQNFLIISQKAIEKLNK
jgi:large subunit ribosomal protein L4